LTYPFITFYDLCYALNMGIYVVDKLTEFSIPNSKDQLYVLREVIEKVYMFKVWIESLMSHLLYVFHIQHLILFFFATESTYGILPCSAKDHPLICNVYSIKKQ